MNLKQKKKTSAKILGVGTNKVVFDSGRLDEIKECITKQDIRDLIADGAIKTRENSGRRKIVTQGRRRAGSRKKRVRNTKRDYMNRVRKLRKYLFYLRANNKISKENYQRLRVYIKVQQLDTVKKIDEFLRDKK